MQELFVRSDLVKALATVQQHRPRQESAPGIEGLHMANTQQQKKCCHYRACPGWEFQVQPDSHSSSCNLLLCLGAPVKGQAVDKQPV